MDHARFKSEPAGESVGNENSEASSITSWVSQIGFGFRNICQRHNIEIEMDLDEVSDVVDGKPIKDALIAMVNNAIESMPNGGELEINLVDGNHQWEIEVADSGIAKSSFPRDGRQTGLAVAGNEFDQTDGNNDRARTDLPVAEPIELNRHLIQLESLALELNATCQTWNCPLGGTAHVLVVPKKIRPKKSTTDLSACDPAELTTPKLSNPNTDQRNAA